MKNSFLDKIKEKQKERNLYQDFELLSVPVRLSNVDMQSIMIEIRDFKVTLTEKYESGVYKGKKVNEVEWNKYLTKRREALEAQHSDDSEKIEEAMQAEVENKPKSEAERLAGQEATSDAMFSILPTFFTNPVTGERVLPRGSKDLEEFTAIVRGSVEMITAISQNFVALQSKMDELTDEVKNLPGETASPITSSDSK